MAHFASAKACTQSIPRCGAQLPTVSILDLTPETLARIAALVSKGSQCRTAGLPFRIACGRKAWKRLKPLRYTCRALRDACYLAVASIRPFFRPWIRRFRSEAVLVSSVLSFSSLVEFHLGYVDKAFSNAAADLLQRITNLKSLVVHSGGGKSIDVCAKIASFPSSSTLKELKFDRSRGSLEGAVANLLSFPYHSLSSLEFVSGPEIPPLPEHVLKILKTFTFKSVRDPSFWKRPFLHHLSRAPLLRALHLESRNFVYLSWLGRQTRFCSLQILSLERKNARSWRCMKFAVVAAVNGCFPNLERFIVRATMSIDSSEEDCSLFVLLRPMLVACQSSMKVLDVYMSTLMTKEDVDMLNGLNMRQDFELRFSPVSLSRLWAQPCFDCGSLRDAKFLTSINFSGWSLANIDQLCRLPKLRAVKYRMCIVRREEVLKIRTFPGNLKYLELLACRLANRDEKEKIPFSDRSPMEFKWSALTEEEYSEFEGCLSR